LPAVAFGAMNTGQMERGANDDAHRDHDEHRECSAMAETHAWKLNTALHTHAHRAVSAAPRYGQDNVFVNVKST